MYVRDLAETQLEHHADTGIRRSSTTIASTSFAPAALSLLSTLEYAGAWL
jgi:hypothetical protein